MSAASVPVMSFVVPAGAPVREDEPEDAVRERRAPRPAEEVLENDVLRGRRRATAGAQRAKPNELDARVLDVGLEAARRLDASEQVRERAHLVTVGKHASRQRLGIAAPGPIAPGSWGGQEVHVGASTYEITRGRKSVAGDAPHEQATSILFPRKVRSCVNVRSCVEEYAQHIGVFREKDGWAIHYSISPVRVRSVFKQHAHRGQCVSVRLSLTDHEVVERRRFHVGRVGVASILKPSSKLLHVSLPGGVGNFPG